MKSAKERDPLEKGDLIRWNSTGEKAGKVIATYLSETNGKLVLIYTKDPLTTGWWNEYYFTKVNEVPLAAWQVGLIAGITVLIGGWWIGQFIQ